MIIVIVIMIVTEEKVVSNTEMPNDFVSALHYFIAIYSWPKNIGAGILKTSIQCVCVSFYIAAFICCRIDVNDFKRPGICCRPPESPFWH